MGSYRVRLADLLGTVLLDALVCKHGVILSHVLSVTEVLILSVTVVLILSVTVVRGINIPTMNIPKIDRLLPPWLIITEL